MIILKGCDNVNLIQVVQFTLQCQILCDHGNETSYFIKREEFIDRLKKCQLLKKE
jgi:hypothetical protein